MLHLQHPYRLDKRDHEILKGGSNTASSLHQMYCHHHIVEASMKIYMLLDVLTIARLKQLAGSSIMHLMKP